VISVVVPLYNKAPYIERAIHSVLAQTDTDWEMIVVDDGSTDGGGDIVRGIDDPRVQCHTQPNAGAGPARNAGIALARGDLIAFLDADDEYTPDALASFRAAADEHPECVLIFGNLREPGSGERIPSSVATGLVEDYFALYVNLKGSVVTTSGTAVRRKALQEIGGFSDYITGQDVETWCRLALIAPFYYLGKVIGIYYPYLPGSNTMIASGYSKIFPGSVITLRDRLQKGQVPREREASVRQFCDFVIEWYAYGKLRLGFSAEARRALKDDLFELGPRARRLLIASYLPHRIREALLRRKERSTAGRQP